MIEGEHLRQLPKVVTKPLNLGISFGYKGVDTLFESAWPLRPCSTPHGASLAYPVAKLKRLLWPTLLQASPDERTAQDGGGEEVVGTAAVAS